MTLQERVNTTIRDIADFPKPGILFYDITTILKDPILFTDVIEAMAKPFKPLIQRCSRHASLEG